VTRATGNAGLLCAAVLLSCAVVTAQGVAAQAHAGAPRIAIIIDDIGHSLVKGERVIALPAPVTLAVLPFTPYTAALAVRARDAGKDVILHQPMQAMRSGRQERGTMTKAMDSTLLRKALRTSLARVPYAIGVSNHTGSLLTTSPTSMAWLMAEVHAQGLFFLDSRTTNETVAEQSARAAGVPIISRDVFLDYVVEPEAIAHQFDRALRLAERRGFAVLIGHPHDATLSLLERELPSLASRGFQLVPVRALVDSRITRRATLAQLEIPMFLPTARVH
jgi:polysaccharide deacetylase 2 family uncharacterized protein YibQ